MTNQTQIKEKKRKLHIYFKKEIINASRLKISHNEGRSIPILLKCLGGEMIDSEYQKGDPKKAWNPEDKIECNERVDEYQALYAFPKYPNLGLTIKTSIYSTEDNFNMLFTPKEFLNFDVTIGEIERPSLIERLKKTFLKKEGNTKRTELENKVGDLFAGILNSKGVFFY